jgi:hypothetical protein
MPEDSQKKAVENIRPILYVKDMATSIEYYEQGYKALSKIGCVRARTLCRRDCTRGSVY